LTPPANGAIGAVTLQCGFVTRWRFQSLANSIAVERTVDITNVHGLPVYSTGRSNQNNTHD